MREKDGLEVRRTVLQIPGKEKVQGIKLVESQAVGAQGSWQCGTQQLVTGWGRGNRRQAECLIMMPRGERDGTWPALSVNHNSSLDPSGCPPARDSGSGGATGIHPSSGSKALITGEAASSCSWERRPWSSSALFWRYHFCFNREDSVAGPSCWGRFHEPRAWGVLGFWAPLSKSLDL